MLKRTDRLDRRTVERLFKKGKSERLGAITVRYVPNIHGAPRIAFILPKRLNLTPVERNRLRRQLYSKVKVCFPFLPKVDAAFVLHQRISPAIFVKEIEQWAKHSS